jgi:hypothetical protein
MASKQKMMKALSELGASLTQDPARYHYESVEIVAPVGKVWAANLCQVLCFEFDRYSMTKAELWDEVLSDIEQGLLDESQAGE